MKVVKRHLFIVLLAVLGAPSFSDQPIDLSIPTNRYVREHPNVDEMSHWDQKIYMELVGQVPADVGLYAASILQVLSRHAGEQVQLVGEPENWLTSKNAAHESANYLVVFTDIDSDSNTWTPSGNNVDLSPSNVSNRVSKGLGKVGPGCFVAWNADSKNKIAGFVVAVDQRLDVEKQKTCLEVAVPMSFGVSPLVTRLPFRIQSDDNRTADEDYFAKSETIQLLRLSNYCRSVLNDNSFQCPAELLDIFYQYSSDLYRSQNQ